MTDRELLAGDAPVGAGSADAPPSRDRHGGRSAYLHPGQLLVAREPTVITTILGSCVGVCLFDAKAGFGGMNHFLLPHWAEGDQATPRFGNVAMRMLIDGMLRQGSSPSRLQAKVFGGACVIEAYRDRTSRLGEDNGRVASQLLKEAGIRIVASDIGGTRGRKLVFDSATGDVWVRQL